jgi:YVTN family beta-propeller protein
MKEASKSNNGVDILQIRRMMWIVLSAIVILFTGFRAAAAESLSSPHGASQIQRAYVANRDSNHISVIDTVTHAVIHTISLPFEQGGPTGVAVSLDGTRVYVSEENTGYGNFILVIDTATNQVIDTVPIEGQGLYEMAMWPPTGSIRCRWEIILFAWPSLRMEPKFM